MATERRVTLTQRWSGSPACSGVSITEIRIHTDRWEVWRTLDDEEEPLSKDHADGSQYHWRSAVEVLASEDGGVDDPVRVEGAEGIEAEMLALACGSEDQRSAARVLLELTDGQLGRLLAEVGALRRVCVRILDIRWALDCIEWEGRLGDLLPEAPDTDLPVVAELESRARALDEEGVAWVETKEGGLAVHEGWPTKERVDRLYDRGVNAPLPTSALERAFGGGKGPSGGG